MSLPKSSETTLAELRTTAEHALESVTAQGADHAEVAVSTGDRLEVSVSSGEVELIKEARSSGLSVRVVRDGRVATSATTNLDPRALDAFMGRVIEMAELSEEDPLAVPPDPDELDGRWRDLDLFDPKTARIQAPRAIKLATTAERAALRHDKRITASDGASFSRTTGHSVLATTGGFLGANAGTSQYLAVHVIADDDGDLRNGHYWSGGRHFEQIGAPAEVGKEAAHRAVRTLGARKMDTGIYPVVFDREAASGLLGLLASCIVGDAVYREQSYLARRLGTRVASDKVTIIDDPTLARGPASRSYDGEGRKARRNIVVKKGELKTFLLDTYSARKLSMDPTGSGGGGGGIPHATTTNFVLRNGRTTPKNLLRGIERGLYVTNTMGFGFQPVSGDFSRGAGGFLIEGGELSEPIAEVTISRNLDQVLQGIEAVGNDLELRTSMASPSLRVDQMTISGR